MISVTDTLITKKNCLIIFKKPRAFPLETKNSNIALRLISVRRDKIRKHTVHIHAVLIKVPLAGK